MGEYSLWNGLNRGLLYCIVCNVNGYTLTGYMAFFQSVRSQKLVFSLSELLQKPAEDKRVPIEALSHSQSIKVIIS
jgi:hypothetical protein